MNKSIILIHWFYKVRIILVCFDAGTPVLLGQEQLTHSMNIIKESIKKYLKAEEAAMNRRIKEYTEKQQEHFSLLKSRAFQDKAAIFR